MANGRALPSALLFDTLLGRAWDIALANYGKAQSLSDIGIPDTLSVASGAYNIPKFTSNFNTDAGEALLGAHDIALKLQLQEVSEQWAREFEGVMRLVAPVGEGFTAAVSWLRGLALGQDGLGYLGQDHRIAQHQRQAAEVLAGFNARGLPAPPGAMPALKTVVADITGLYGQRLTVQLDADREAARKKLTIEGVETLVKLRNAALDAAMDYVFAQMNMMFDVFGRNNDYLTALRRDEQGMQTRMQVRSAELSRWDANLQVTHAGATDSQRKTKVLNDRSLGKFELSMEQRIKRTRRLSSRAASALNSAGVQVNSTASESNNVDAEE